MIPFITRHVFALPRTVANQNITRQKLRTLGYGITCLAGACFLAGCMAWTVVMILGL